MSKLSEPSNSIHIINLLKCSYELKSNTNYLGVYAYPATGKLYVTPRSPHFISGHVRMRGKKGGKYPYNYTEMLDNIFGRENNILRFVVVVLEEEQMKNHLLHTLQLT